jgi:Fe-S-cluster containining protein
MRITRPVWRQFSPKFIDNAAEWVRSGGHAVIVYRPSKLRLVLGVDKKGELTEQGLWAVLALEQHRAKKEKEGPLKGLFTILAAPHARYATLDWCERDSGFAKPTRVLKLDCLECGACCHESNVILYDSDLERFREAGRTDLLTNKHLIRKKDGKLRLRFLPSGRCPQLESDNKCNVYAARPFNCSVFPAGSEACLAARESTLNLRDDVDARPLA